MVRLTGGNGFNVKPLKWPNMLLFSCVESFGSPLVDGFSRDEFMSSVLLGVAIVRPPGGDAEPPPLPPVPECPPPRCGLFLMAVALRLFREKCKFGISL